MNSNYRKGGLVGLAATSIGLQQHCCNVQFLEQLLPPILHCFDDPEARVRYYACESLYNVAKVARQSVLAYFNPIFEGLAKLFADVDVDVKNGANLLDRLIKDIVIEADNPTFQVDNFLPLLQTYIRRTNPYIRQLIVGWITLLDSIPDISMLDYLPDFLDGLFNMLSDSNREIRQAADAALSEFLRALSQASVLEVGPLVSILVQQCSSEERLNRLTAVTWLAELVHHPGSHTSDKSKTASTTSGDHALLPYHSDILGAILSCISDGEREIRLVAERTNDDLRAIVRNTKVEFQLLPLLETITAELLEQQEDVPTKMASLGWINMLLEKCPKEMNQYTENLLPVLLRTLSDPSDAVVLLDLQVMSRISLARSSSSITNKSKLTKSATAVVSSDASKANAAEEEQFQLVLNAILNLFAHDRQLLETRGSLVIRKLCVLLNAQSVYLRMSETLCSLEKEIAAADDTQGLDFIATMVQTLNLILLTASELHDLRSLLAGSMLPPSARSTDRSGESKSNNDDDARELGRSVFCKLFSCWCHNPVATFSLCLLAQAYDLSFCIVKRFSETEDVTVGFLMQIDKLVHLLESPIFIHLRLQLLNVEAPYHASLLKSIYGILMCLPQGDAFRLLNERLTTVCNLREDLGMAVPSNTNVSENGTATGNASSTASYWRGRQAAETEQQLMKRFDAVQKQHQEAQRRASKATMQQQLAAASTVAGGTGGSSSSKSPASSQQVSYPHRQDSAPPTASSGAGPSAGPGGAGAQEQPNVYRHSSFGATSSASSQQSASASHQSPGGGISAERGPKDGSSAGANRHRLSPRVRDGRKSPAGASGGKPKIGKHPRNFLNS